MGKLIAIIAGLLGLIAVFLGFVIPDIGAWFRIETSIAGTVVYGMYVNGIGMVSGVGLGQGQSGIMLLELLGGVICIIGALLCMSGGAKESKGLGVIGGILMLLAPILLIVDLMIAAEDLNSILSLLGGGGELSILFGSITVGTATMAWGIWIGAFLAMGAGILGIIGGATA